MTKEIDAQRPWRTLIRCRRVQGDFVFLIIPTWGNSEEFELQKSELPPEISTRMVQGYRCHAKVNLGAACREDVHFTDWETT